MAAALIGRDTWRFGTVAVLVGVVLLAVGAWLNREYLREVFVFRGAARRGEKRSEPRRRRRDRQHGRTGSRCTGLADSPPSREPRRDTWRSRGADRLTAAEGVASRGKPPSEDTPTDGQPRDCASG